MRQRLRSGAVRLRPDSSVLSVEQAGQTVLLHQRRGEYYGLDGVGTFVWEALRRSDSFDDIVSSVVATYEVSRDDATRDVANLLADLAARGLARDW